MFEANAKVDIAIVGAGPVGLVAANLLAARGYQVAVFEKDAAPQPHSRAIGIHPVSLEVLESIGAAAPLIEAGVAVRGGMALTTMTKQIGHLDFDGLPGRYPFVLSLPQGRTESILEGQLSKHARARLERRCELMGLTPKQGGVELVLRRQDVLSTTRARLVLGCDGKGSSVRGFAGIDYEGAPYPDRFIMGDFEDTTDFLDRAAIFLHPDGLIESFPLPQQRRRWVVKVDERDASAGEHAAWRPRDGQDPVLRARLEALVEARVGHGLGGAKCFMLSRFGVQHFLASTFHRGRIALAGDAAHVVSPIGGQGMNLGILDAARLVGAIDGGGAGVLEDSDALSHVLARYGQKSRGIALKATRRSAFFMKIGQRRSRPTLRDALVKLLISRALAPASARLFTMRGLDWTPI